MDGRKVDRFIFTSISEFAGAKVGDVSLHPRVYRGGSSRISIGRHDGELGLESFEPRLDFILVAVFGGGVT